MLLQEILNYNIYTNKKDPKPTAKLLTKITVDDKYERDQLEKNLVDN